jgi:hypothetical protein
MSNIADAVKNLKEHKAEMRYQIALALMEGQTARVTKMSDDYIRLSNFIDKAEQSKHPAIQQYFVNQAVRFIPLEQLVYNAQLSKVG